MEQVVLDAEGGGERRKSTRGGAVAEGGCGGESGAAGQDVCLVEVASRRRGSSSKGGAQAEVEELRVPSFLALLVQVPILTLNVWTGGDAGREERKEGEDE